MHKVRLLLIVIVFVFIPWGMTAAQESSTPSPDERRAEAITLNNLGLQAESQGQYADALGYYEQVLAIVRDIRDRSGEGVTLTNIASVYRAQGKYGQALDYYNQALAIQRKGIDRKSLGVTLNNIGALYMVQGQYADALDYYNQALAIAKETHDRAGEGTTLNNIGLTYQSQGQYADALDYYTEALTIVREVNNQAHIGTTLNNIGGVYDAQGQYADALDNYTQALAIARETHDRAGEGTTLNNIGGVYQSQGRYADALDNYTQALAIAQQIGDPAAEETALNNIGGEYNAQGQYGQALDYLTQALAIEREIGDYAGEGTTLNNIGLVYKAQGQYGQALDYLTQALAIEREVGDQAGEGSTLNNIGDLYDDEGQDEQALDNYTQALAIRKEVGDRAGEGVTLGNIGLVFYRQGHYADALDYYKQALTIAQEIGSQADGGKVLTNIGATYTVQEQYADALDADTQALAIEREAGDRVGEGVTLGNIGGVHTAQGQYTDALDAYMQALAIAQEVGDQAHEGAALGDIGALYDIALNDVPQAISYYRQAVDVQESLLQSAALNQTITSLAGLTTNIDLYALLTRRLIQQNDLPSALEYAERGRGILSRDELRRRPINFRANLTDQSLLQQEQHLRLQLLDDQNHINALNRDLSASAADRQKANTALQTDQTNYDQLLGQMQLEGGFLSRQLALDVSSLHDIQAALPPDTTLLIYGLSEYGSYVLLVTATDLHGFILDASTPQVEALVRSFAADGQANSSTLSGLYNLIFTPIADKITTHNLIISPDGVLNYIPFAALQAPDGSYLIDHYTISMIPSGTTLALLKQRQPAGAATSNGLVLSQASAPGLPLLRSADSEASAIAQVLGVSAIPNATAADLRTHSGGAAVISISAHAQLNRFAPLFSAIDLGADQDDDGQVQVSDIYQLDLSQGTKLVILSGCDTASGGTGEDFGLLTRAFLGAGAEQVVASLWSVDDAATADLLTAFIQARATVGSDAAALREAMLTTRQQHPDPYYWASFILVGLDSAPST